MNEPQKRNLVLIAILIAVIITSYFIFDSRRSADSLPSPSSTSTPQEVATTTTVDIEEINIGIEGSGDFTVTRLPLGQPAITAPSLSRPISFNANLSAADQAVISENIQSARNAILTSPNDMNLWLKLSVYYKIAGDPAAAEEVWIYVSKRAPSNFVAFYNLAELYAYDLKDYLKAETNYRLALSKDTTQVSVYRAMYTFYRYVIGQDDKARAILEEGIAKNPGTSQDLKYLLDHYDEV